jgi:predicted nucleotidyltransferase
VKPSIALEKNREAVRAAIRRYPTIANPRVFGSVLHGDDTEESDLDLLVDALPGTTLFTLIGLQDDLANVVGVPVDLKTPEELSKYFREEVLAEAVPL